MEVKIDQKVKRELKKKGYNVDETERIIQKELIDYDFEGADLFDLFFYYNGERTFAQGKVVGGVAHCYWVATDLKIFDI